MKKEIIINDVFEDIDRRLTEEGIPITLRYMKAIGEVSKFFGNTSIPISPKSLLPNNEFGNQLCIWLSDWYHKKYGDNQRYNSDLGFFYQKIRGDLWRYRVPEFFGNCDFFIDKNLEECGGNNETNILRMSPKMTQSYVNSLTDLELKHLASSFGNAIEVFQIISVWQIKRIPFYKAIDADFKTICAQLEPHIVNYGQAKWAYLQCAEKILKSWLLNAGLTEKQLKNKFGHNIRKLLNEFNKYYEADLSLDKIESISCSADARYGDDSFDSENIIEAQEWLFNLIKLINFSPKLATI